MLKDDSRSGFLTRWSTVGLLIVGLAMAVPLFAQVKRNMSRRKYLYRVTRLETLVEYQKMLEANPLSSLANYRIAELLFKHRHYQASANHYRDALHGDGLPRWTRVWSHIELGKIFDFTAQRQRAMNKYQLALETEDNTLNALAEAEATYCRGPLSRRELSKSLSAAPRVKLTPPPSAGWPVGHNSVSERRSAMQSVLEPASNRT